MPLNLIISHWKKKPTGHLNLFRTYLLAPLTVDSVYLSRADFTSCATCSGQLVYRLRRLSRAILSLSSFYVEANCQIF